VITGVGAITPVGDSAAQTWEAIKAGKNGIAPITAYDTSEMKAKLAAEVKSDPAALIDKAKARKMDRFTQLAVVAAREAFEASGLSPDNLDYERTDVIVGAGIGGLDTTVKEHDRALSRGFDRTSPFFIPMTIANMAAGQIAIELGLKGDCLCTVTACASSANAVGEAMRHIRHGYADAVLAGGAEAVVIELAIGGFTAMQALHTGSDPERASIPFDAERSGFVLGEGAGALVLEDLDHALARGANIIAEVKGYGAACDAYHMTAPDPEGNGAALAMRKAIADAGLEPSDISYINAHGTSTPLNDKGEVLAIKRVFGLVDPNVDNGFAGVGSGVANGVEGADAIAEGRGARVAGVDSIDGAGSLPPISSTKSMTGHLLGAAGAVEAIICALAVHDGFIPPTINYRIPDPDCDVDVVPNVGRQQPVAHALTNSLGFGGHNGALVISRYEEN
jgi:3-oxoacyl-[acyl-carrier-protein] synthase II